MAGRLILLLVQVVLAWVLAPLIMSKLPHIGALSIFIEAAVMAVLVWLIGFVGALALKDVAQPSPATLTFALVGALIGAGLTLVPDITKAVSGVIRGMPILAYPLACAVIGYAVKR